MTEDDSEASVGRREWLSVLGLGGALATVSGGSQPAKAAPVSDRLITLGPEDNPKGEIYEVGDDLVLEHSKTGATFKYDDTAGAWVVSDPLEVAELDAIDTADFSQTAGPAHREGRLGYSSDQMSFHAFNDKSDVTLNVGEENIIRVTNQTGVTIQNGEAVFISGAGGGDNPATVELAKADDTSTAVIAGLATMDIPNNEEGYVTSFGLVRDVDTSAFETGDPLWVSATTAGALTNTEPDSPNFSIPVGFVQKKSASSGQILVETGGPRPQIYTEDAVPFADAGGKLIEDPTNLNYDPGTDTLTTPALSTDGLVIDDTHHWASQYDGADPDARLANAITAATGGDVVHLEAATYDSDVSISGTSLRGLRLAGPGDAVQGNGAVVQTTWTISTLRVTVERVRFDPGNSGLLDYTNNNGLIKDCAGTVTIDGLNVLVYGHRGGSVTFESGTSGGIIDASQGVSVTDNGSNTVGDNG